MARVLSADSMLHPSGDLRPGWVRIEDGHLTEVGEGSPPAGAEHVDGILAPGFVDVHCHGGGGAAFDDGAEAAETARQTHRSHGTTSMLASLVSDDPARLLRTVQDLAPLVRDGRLAGVHLEGPWLSRERAGAHDPDLLSAPDATVLEELLGTGVVRMVTLAPELPGGTDAVRRIAAAGAIAAVGHSDATYRQTREALAAGARAGTHLFNAMRGLHHREPGPAAALLEDGEAFVELIADGVHVHPAMLGWVHRSAPGRCLLITDAMSATGGPDGHYRLGRLHVRVDDGVARIADTGTIAGSTLTMDRAVRFAVDEAGFGAEDALRAASEVPARLLGRDDIGVLRRGARADLVLLEEDLTVREVLPAS
ncbi:N-acetylglucosamine-6-phosphate deacetylase [Nesterenkonia marinintestina]|uniref:N-acetylglucosamine-6-phosphate deacetylase n=1 Tax=Nesterenkonia marinintestina TaxID=2979865 RepID=UPI0021BEE458|nr:N-acetylglucosamine-6-phosphate deacetylase [Nesterenkonia sp. GX14115]